MRAIVTIPARYESSRFPGKPLIAIKNKPMIQWVYEACKKANLVDDVIVATDDIRIFDAVDSFGGKAVMTGECSCGTDRAYLASKEIDADIVVNVQGDEPLILPEDIDRIVRVLEKDDSLQMVTLASLMEKDEDICNPNNVKVVLDNKGYALYFSRSRIPNADRADGNVPCYKHIGIYGYKKTFLETFVNMDVSSNEKYEKLEQLRAIDNGYRIKVLETDYQGIGVDVPEDVLKVESILS